MAYQPGTFLAKRKNQIYLIDTKHKISAGLHYVSVRASINNIRRAEPGPHLLQGPGTCCGKLPRVSSDQWPGDRGGRGWVHNLDLVTHRGADSVHHRDQQGPGVGPRLPGVAHRKYKHHSRVRAETATRENITGVWTMWTLWTLSAGPPPIMIMASFFSRPPTSSSSQRLNTD